ncbi:hypothetical protein FB451DRAFT_1049110 [Mycena latifolia]|nr:hypothetical protein FB451DRAFT_1049110 [Mycena latifolia]
MAQPTMPARGDRNAPTFDSSKPRELPRYFSDLEFHFTRCNITDAAEMKSHATRFLSVRDQDAWEALTEFITDGTTYADFKSAVLKLYPGTDADRKYSLADLDVLIGAYARTGILSKGDFSEFYRDFTAISTFLIRKDRLSAAEQSRAFRRAMQPQSLWDRMHQRLQIKKPDVHPDDPYGLADLKEAADCALQSTSVAPTTSESSALASHPPIKQESEVATFVTLLVDALAKSGVLSPQNSNQPSYSNSAPRNSNARPDGCTYCSGPHYIANCEIVTSDAQAGCCKRNINGRVVLPSGTFVPREIQGHNLRERMEEWHRINPGQIAAPQLMLDTHANYPSPNRLTIEERQKSIDEENQVLENMRQAQYALQTRAQARRVAEAGGPVEELERPIRQTFQPLKPPSASAATNRAPSAPAPAEIPFQLAPEHPYANARDAAYAEPKGRNYRVQPPPPAPAKRHDPAYRTIAPVFDHKTANEVFDRSMNTPVTLSQRELLSISPDVRARYKDATTGRRTATDAPIAATMPQLLNTVENPLPFDSEPNALVASDDFPTLYDAGVLPDPGELAVAVDSCAIRSVMPIVDNQERIECIYDTGSQIVAMSEAVCNSLQLSYNPRITINMESANGSITPSLGLARNVPFKFGSITMKERRSMHLLTALKFALSNALEGLLNDERSASLSYLINIQ